MARAIHKRTEEGWIDEAKPALDAEHSGDLDKVSHRATRHIFTTGRQYRHITREITVESKGCPEGTKRVLG